MTLEKKVTGLFVPIVDERDVWFWYLQCNESACCVPLQRFSALQDKNRRFPTCACVYQVDWTIDWHSSCIYLCLKMELKIFLFELRLRDKTFFYFECQTTKNAQIRCSGTLQWEKSGSHRNLAGSLWQAFARVLSKCFMPCPLDFEPNQICLDADADRFFEMFNPEDGRRSGGKQCEHSWLL